MKGADPLAAIISLLRPQTVLSKIVSGAGRWAVRYEPHHDPSFCLVLEGRCVLAADGVGVLELQAGDVVLLPETPAFTLASELGVTPTVGVPTPRREMRHGARSGPPTMRMLGGYFHFAPSNAALLVRLLPPVIHVACDAPEARRVQRVVEAIGDEATADRPGRALILERLVEVLLVEALRCRPAAVAREQGLLAGLAEPGLARALRAIHGDVARRWTVAELGRAAGMSRAVFAERFARIVGMPPMQYLLEWRMAMAKDLLTRERPPLADAAERVGYQSASAFSTAFTRLTGVSPSRFARGAGQRAGAVQPPGAAQRPGAVQPPGAVQL
jgi:AraC-like DNA-binding protein